MKRESLGAILASVAALSGCHGQSSKKDVDARTADAVVCSLAGADLTLINGWSCERQDAPKDSPGGPSASVFNLTQRLAVKFGKPISLNQQQGRTPAELQTWFNLDSLDFAKSVKRMGRTFSEPLRGGTGYFVEGLLDSHGDHLVGQGVIVSASKYVQIGYVEPLASKEELEAENDSIRELLNGMAVH